MLTTENPTFSTVFDVRCAQSYLLSSVSVVVAEDDASCMGDCCSDRCEVAGVDLEIESSECGEWDNNGVGVIHLREHCVEVQHTTRSCSGTGVNNTVLTNRDAVSTGSGG